MVATALGEFILEHVGDFFSDPTRSLIGTGVLIFLIIVWLVIQTTDFKKASQIKNEGDISIKAAQLQVQQAILERLKDKSISEDERRVLIQQLSRPWRN